MEMEGGDSVTQSLKSDGYKWRVRLGFKTEGTTRTLGDVQGELDTGEGCHKWI